MLHLNYICNRDHSSNSSCGDIFSLECCYLLVLNDKGSGAIRRPKIEINTFFNSTK